jgi:hypothetical protein
LGILDRIRRAPEPALRGFQDRVFADDIWSDYNAVATARERWAEVVDSWAVDAIIAKKRAWMLIPELRRHEAWEVFYEDDGGVIFVRASHSTTDAATKPDRAASRIAASRFPTPSLP